MSSSASDRAPLFCRWNRSPYLLKPLQKTRCTILKYFDQEDCPPLTFGLFAKACCFLQRFFRLRKELHLRRNYLLKKSAETLRFCGKWSNFFRRPWYCLQMQAETAWTLKSSFVSVMLIEHRRLLTLSKKSLIIFSYILRANYIFELGR